jgi:CubicO group peptidase (beta-lactamase class C family)
MHLKEKCAVAAAWLIIASPCVAQGEMPSVTPNAAATTLNAATVTGHTLTQADVVSWLDGLVPYAMRSGDIAGGVVVVVKDGQILAEKGYGYSDVSAKKAVDPETTLFRPGSITKLFTWTAVMQLVEQGKLDLDVDINRYLDFRIPARDGEAITLRNLMTHTPGFEERLKGLLSSHLPPPPGEDLKSWIPKRIFDPGKIPAYSNYGAALAGYIVERVSGESYADYIDHHILAPLGMLRSSVRQPLPAALQASMSKGYRLASGPAEYYEYADAPAGSLAATGADMARFMIAHLQNGAFNGVQILKPQTAVQMHANQPKIYPALNGMALGFYETSRNGHRVIAHNGATQFFRSDLHLFLDDGVGIFISLNSNGRGTAAGDLHEALFYGFADRYFPATAPLPEPLIDARTAAEHAGLVAGNWESSRRSASSFLSLTGLLSSMKISANPDGTILVPRLGHAERTPWREIAPFVWREVDGQDKLQAVVVNGLPTMIGFGAAPPAALLRVPAWRSPVWMLPALGAALSVLFFTALSWPIAAGYRRAYGIPFALRGAAASRYRLIRLFSLGTVLVFLAFPATLLYLSGDAQRFSADTDAWNLGLQAAALVVFVGVVAVAVWDAILVWTGARRWFARLWSAAVAASCLLILFTACAFHLMGFNVNY